MFDVLEFVADNFSQLNRRVGTLEQFQKQCNAILAAEASAYRFVHGRISLLTRDEEIEEVDRVLEEAKADPRLDAVYKHLKDAVDKLGNRPNPDFRGCGDDAIDAVEAACQLVSGSPSATLTDGLNALESRGVVIHPALRQGFIKLYGYAGDSDGLRHALKPGTDPNTLVDLAPNLLSRRPATRPRRRVGLERRANLPELGDAFFQGARRRESGGNLPAAWRRAEVWLTFLADLKNFPRLWQADNEAARPSAIADRVTSSPAEECRPKNGYVQPEESVAAETSTHYKPERQVFAHSRRVEARQEVGRAMPQG